MEKYLDLAPLTSLRPCSDKDRIRNAAAPLKGTRLSQPESHTLSKRSIHRPWLNPGQIMSKKLAYFQSNNLEGPMNELKGYTVVVPADT